MFNLPYISYGIFAFVLVAVGLIAWKKGFRAALCSLFLTFATVGVIIGVVYGIYGQIAPLFSDLIRNHFGGDGAYDFNYMANAAKPQVLAICIAIGFIPVFGILFGILYPIYRWLKKKDYPIAVALIGTNSKKVKTKKTKANRVVSVTASSVTALISAGFVASATNVAFTTSKSYSNFNRITNWISFGTSYGFANDSLSLHKMYDFIPLTKEESLMKIMQVFAPNSTTPLSSQDVQAILTHEDYEKLRDLLSSSETEVLLNTLISPIIKNSESIQYDLLGKNVTVSTNKWRPIGNESSSTTYLNNFNAIEALYQGVNFGFDDSTANAIVNWMKKNTIQDFKDTEASKLLEKNKNDLKALNNKLDDANSKLSRLKSYKNTFNSLVTDLKTKMQGAIIAMNQQIDNYNQIVDRSNPNSILIKAVKAIGYNAQSPAASTGAYGDERAAFGNVLNAGNDFEQNTGISAAQFYDINKQPSLDVDADPNLSGAPYQIALSEKNAAQVAYDRAKKDYDDAVALQGKYSDALEDLRTKQTANDNELVANQNKLRQAETDKIDALSAAQTAQTVANGELTTANNNWNAETDPAKKADLKIIVDQKQKAATEATANYNAELNAEPGSKHDIYNNLKTENDTLSQTRVTLNSQIQIANTNLTTQSGVATSTQNIANNAYITLGQKNQAFTAAQVTAKSFVDNFTSVWQIWKEKKNKLSEKQSDLNNAIDTANKFISNFNLLFESYAGAKGYINLLGDAGAQLAILDWNGHIASGRYTETFSGIGMDTTNYKFGNAPVNSSNGVDFTSAISQSQINTIQPIPQSYDEQLSNIVIDSTVWGEDTPKSDQLSQYPYNSSIKYIQNDDTLATSVKVNSQMIGSQLVIINGNTPKYKDENDIQEGTEGLISIIKYNIAQKDFDITNSYSPYMENQKDLYDQNVAEYIKFFLTHFEGK